MKLQLTSIDDATERIKAAENKRYQETADNLTAELKLTKAGSAARKKVQDEQADNERTHTLNLQKAEDDKFEQQQAATLAHGEALLKLDETIDERRIGHIRYLGERRRLTQTEVEDQVFDVQTKAFNRRLEFLAAQQKQLEQLAGVEIDDQGNIIKGAENVSKINQEALQKILDAINQLFAEQENRQEEHTNNRAAAQREDIKNTRAWSSEILELEWRTTLAALDDVQMKIDIMRAHGATQKQLRDAQRAHDLEAERVEHERRMKEIADAEAVFNAEVHTYAERLKAQKEFNTQREIENDRHETRDADIKRDPKVTDDLMKWAKETTSVHDFVAQSIIGMKGQWGNFVCMLRTVL